MEMVKIGDLYRILYVAKNFTTGLTNVTGTAIDPSGSTTAISWDGTDPTAGFCELAGGVYYMDYATTGKAAGEWVFKADSATQSAPAAKSVQFVTEATLDDTIFETLDTNIDSLKADIESGTHGLAQLQSELAVVDGNVDDIEALSIGANGFAAIKGAVDAVQSAVSAIGNSTRNTWLANTPVVIPDSGSITRRVWLNIFDSSGNLEDPDSNDVDVTVYNEAGTDVTASYLAGAAPQNMTRASVGEYYIDFTIESTDTATQLRFKHEYLESTNPVVRDGIVDVVGALAGDLETKLDNIETKIDTVDTVVDGIVTDVATVDGKIDTVDTVVDGIQADLDNATDGLGAIKAAVDANQADLTSIESKIDTVDTVVDTINTNTDTIETTLGTPAGASVSADLAALQTAVDNNQADLTTVESKIDTVDSVVDGIQADLDNATDGLGALAAKLDTIDTEVGLIQADLDNGTDGLGALLSEIQNVSLAPGGYMI